MLVRALPSRGASFRRPRSTGPAISLTTPVSPQAPGVPLLVGSGVTAVADIRSALVSTADDINSATLPGFDSTIGNGLLDVEEAVTGTQSAP